MKLGRVAGTVVSTINTPLYEDRRLLLCDLIDPAGEPRGGYLIAIDTVDAGAGETVLILDEGNSARQVLDWEDGEVRALVVGIVDEIDLAERMLESSIAGKPRPRSQRRSREPR